MAIVKPTRAKRFFYMKNANMNWSFDTLAAMAEQMLGASPKLGDILIADNAKGDKRKVLQFTAKGWLIYYARFHKGLSFIPLAKENGKLDIIKENIL